MEPGGQSGTILHFTFIALLCAVMHASSHHEVDPECRLMFRHGACMHALTFEVCFIYHQGLSVIALEARSVEAPVGKFTTSGALLGI